jgi:hypothetical protein
MNIIKNEGLVDRGIRLISAEIFFLLGFFWFGGMAQIALYILAIVLFGTTILGFCGLYKVLGINTCASLEKELSKTMLSAFIVVIVGIAIGGSYASDFFSKKFFLEDYNAMNQYYKQALFFTGQDKRDEAIVNYTTLVTNYDVFQTKYTNYHPYVVSNDKQFNADIQKIATMIAFPKEKIMTGDLKSAHLDLEQVRPVFQDILKRNGFSMLAVYLVDFHDAMEKIIAASDAKDSNLVLSLYPEVNEKLNVVEEVANDPEIEAIRQNLEQLITLAKSNQPDALPAKAGELKSSFVKVYLKRG